MRRRDREIQEEETMLEIMKNCDCCRLGLMDGQQAYIVPMNFGFAKENGRLSLYFHCAAEGKKLELLKTQTCVSFEMDSGHGLVTGKRGCDYSFFYRSILGTGNVEFLTTPDEKANGLTQILAHYDPARVNWEFSPNLLARTCVLKLTVTDWSCKAHDPHG